MRRFLGDCQLRRVSSWLLWSVTFCVSFLFQVCGLPNGYAYHYDSQAYGVGLCLEYSRASGRVSIVHYCGAFSIEGSSSHSSTTRSTTQVYSSHAYFYRGVRHSIYRYLSMSLTTYQYGSRLRGIHDLLSFRCFYHDSGIFRTAIYAKSSGCLIGLYSFRFASVSSLVGLK